eukprot:m.595875 g.595875  ORF g.595875 m.595875 type:complete len:381 (-) comp22407_c0_seq17:2856-3998(-)
MRAISLIVPVELRSCTTGKLVTPFTRPPYLVPKVALSRVANCSIRNSIFHPTLPSNGLHKKSCFYSVPQALHSRRYENVTLLPRCATKLKCEPGHSSNYVHFCCRSFVCNMLKTGMRPWKFFREFTLIDKKTVIEGQPGKICPVRAFTFKLPTEVPLGLKVELGERVKIWAPRCKKPKSYSPTDVATPGRFDVTAKIYPGGVSSEFLDGLKIGDTARIGGPFPNPLYPLRRRHGGSIVNIVAYGIGMTECFFVARAELQRTDVAQVVLVHANRFAGDALFHDDIRRLQQKYPDKLKFVQIYSRESVPGALRGRIDATTLRDVFKLPEVEALSEHANTIATTRFLVVGSKPMIRSTWSLLESFGFSRPVHGLLERAVVYRL